MKVTYRGFEIEAFRETRLPKHSQIFYDVVRIYDGWELEVCVTEAVSTVREIIQCLKGQVDDYYENPQDWGGPMLQTQEKTMIENDSEAAASKKELEVNPEDFGLEEIPGPTWIGRDGRCYGREHAKTAIKNLIARLRRRADGLEALLQAIDWDSLSDEAESVLWDMIPELK